MAVMPDISCATDGLTSLPLSERLFCGYGGMNWASCSQEGCPAKRTVRSWLCDLCWSPVCGLGGLPKDFACGPASLTGLAVALSTAVPWRRSQVCYPRAWCLGWELLVGRIFLLANFTGISAVQRVPTNVHLKYRCLIVTFG